MSPRAFRFIISKPASSGMSSNVFHVVQGFLRDSWIAQVFLGFLWKMLEDVLEDVEMSNAFPGRRDIYKIRIIIYMFF